MQGHKDTRTKDELAALGYEREDVSLRLIAVWVFWFFFFATMAGVATAGIYHFLVPGGLAPKIEARTRYPAEPRLQDEVSVKTDIYDLRHAENEELHTSGPSTHVKGAYRIPVDHAIKLWSQRQHGSAPATPAAAQQTPAPETAQPTTGGHAPSAEPGGSH